MVSAALFNTNLAQCHTAGHVLSTAQGVYLLFQCFLNLPCLRSGWEPAFAPPLSASDLAILEEAWGAPT